MPEIEQALQSFKVMSDKQWPKNLLVSCRGVWRGIHRTPRSTIWQRRNGQDGTKAGGEATAADSLWNKSSG